MKKEDLIQRAEVILEKEGIVSESDKYTNIEFIEKYILPSLKNSKNTLSDILSFETRDRKGFVGKLKSFVLSKLKNIVINVVEKQSAKQQKFNELVFLAMEKLVEEVKSKSK